MAASASLAGGRVALSAGASLLTNPKAERNAEATLYVGNVDGGVSEAMLEELFVQVGRVRSVSMPKDRVQNTHMGYGFVEMHSPEDAQYVRDAPPCPHARAGGEDDAHSVYPRYRSPLRAGERHLNRAKHTTG